MQLIGPQTKISTLKEVFNFVACADPKRQMLFNIESKINPLTPWTSHSVDDFVQLQHAAFLRSGYSLRSIIVSLDLHFR